MTQKYENIMVAVDGSHESELAFEKGVNVALRNGSRLTIAHVIDTRALQSVSTFDADVYEDLQEDAKKLTVELKEKAQKSGVKYVDIGYRYPRRAQGRSNYGRCYRSQCL